MKKIQITHIKTADPTGSNTIANGYNIGQWWENTTTGAKFYHKTDGVWVELISGGGGSSVWGSITGTLSSQTDLQTALNGKVDENTAITGATKTKVTYDSKGLITAGADASLAELTDDTTHRVVTDAQIASWNALIGGSIFQTTWNANTNTPTLASGTGTKGYYYIVATLGATNIDGITDWKVGDWAIFDGTVWRKVDNTDAVSSVNSLTGAVSLDSSNVPDTINKRYVTDANLTVLGNTTGTNTGDNAVNSLYSGLASSKQDTLTESNFGSFANSLTAKTTPLDADLVNIVDTADSNKQKKVTWTNVKDFLKTYFDTLYTAPPKFLRLTSAYTLTSTTNLQKLFNVGTGSNGTFDITANKSYQFTCELSLTAMSATSGNFGIGFIVSGTSSNVKLQMHVNACKGALVTPTTDQHSYIEVLTGADNVVTSSTQTTGKVTISGLISTTETMTITPSIKLGIAAAAIVGEGSNFFLTEIGSNTVTSN
jgi:hypothetical protein